MFNNSDTFLYILTATSICHIIASFYFCIKLKKSLSKNNINHYSCKNYLLIIMLNAIASVSKVLMLNFENHLIYINPQTKYIIFIAEYLEWFFCLPLSIILFMNNLFIYYSFYEYLINLFFIFIMYIFGLFAGFALNLYLFHIYIFISFFGIISFIYFETILFFEIIKDINKLINFYIIMLIYLLYGAVFYFFGQFLYHYYMYLFLDIINKFFVSFIFIKC
jgi:hypothetical protein